MATPYAEPSAQLTGIPANGGRADAARSPSPTGALEPEWRRIAELTALAEALRSGMLVDDGFAENFEVVAEQVRRARDGGCWAGLAKGIPRDRLERFVQLDLDLMAMALAPEARPSLAPHLQSLQPQIAEPWPSLALIQELLMLDAAEETGALYSRLSPDAPLLVEGLVRILGEGPYQVIRATSKLTRLALGRCGELAPPPGALLETRRGRWEDLIVPPRTLRTLRDFAAWARHASTLADRLGARALGGPLCLFTGPSGVGKSFAARVIAGELSRASNGTGAADANWSLYTVDIGRVMSKYVGETEQNINALLDAVEGRRAVLQVDEADGLLGRRGEISDARDNFANVMVSHLLSRLERHRSPVILTSNLRSNIDSAFLRRFQLVVDFPMPDQAARGRLWDKLLPPTDERDATIDLGLLATSVQLSGGSIHNACVYATVLAMEEYVPVHIRHVARAVWAELGKENRQVRHSELGALVRHMDEDPT